MNCHHLIVTHLRCVSRLLNIVLRYGFTKLHAIYGTHSFWEKILHRHLVIGLLFLSRFPGLAEGDNSSLTDSSVCDGSEDNLFCFTTSIVRVVFRGFGNIVMLLFVVQVINHNHKQANHYEAAHNRTNNGTSDDVGWMKSPLSSQDTC